MCKLAPEKDKTYKTEKLYFEDKNRTEVTYSVMQIKFENP